MSACVNVVDASDPYPLLVRVVPIAFMLFGVDLFLILLFRYEESGKVRSSVQRCYFGLPLPPQPLPHPHPPKREKIPPPPINIEEERTVGQWLQQEVKG